MSIQVWEVRERIFDYGFDEDGYVLETFVSRDDAIAHAKSYLAEQLEEEEYETTVLFEDDEISVFSNLNEEERAKIDPTSKSVPKWLYSFVLVWPLTVK